jgi:hypothetical protein
MTAGATEKLSLILESGLYSIGNTKFLISLYFACPSRQLSKAKRTFRFDRAVAAFWTLSGHLCGSEILAIRRVRVPVVLQVLAKYCARPSAGDCETMTVQDPDFGICAIAHAIR